MVTTASNPSFIRALSNPINMHLLRLPNNNIRKTTLAVHVTTNDVRLPARTAGVTATFTADTPIVDARIDAIRYDEYADANG